MSSSSNMSRSSTSTSTSDDDSLNNTEGNPRSIFHIFNDAAQYGKLLARDSEDSDSVNGFAKLVGRDLTPSEQAIASRVTKLSVAGNTWTTEELSGEPDSYLDDTPDSQTVSSVSSQTSDEGKPWKPTSKELIQLLVEEFGALATEDEPEEIIFETDAGLFLDVAIVVCNRTQRSCGLRGLTDPMSDFHRASFT